MQAIMVLTEIEKIKESVQAADLFEKLFEMLGPGLREGHASPEGVEDETRYREIPR